MLKLRVRSIRRLTALTIFTAGFVSFLAVANLSWAEEQVPVPARKPVVVQEVAHTLPIPKRKPSRLGPLEIIKYSLQDLSESLLGSGSPPLPRAKPFSSGTGALSNADAALYKEIFTLQERGEITKANALMQDLKDQRLRGHVLYQRYMHPTAYSSGFEELRNWMDLYADHPKAIKIYNLALRKTPDDFTGYLRQPEKAKSIVVARDPIMYKGQKYRTTKQRNQAQRAEVESFQKAIRRLIYRDSPTMALSKLLEDKRAQLLDAVEQDLLKASIATGYLHVGKIDEAYTVASESALRSGLNVPMAGWVAGLVAWQRKDYKDSARFFEITARSPYASGWTSAAGAYWAARAHTRARNSRAVNIWLKRAAEHPHSFYGLIATRALGKKSRFNWAAPHYSEAYETRLQKTPQGRRAMALVSAGQMHLAEAELLRLHPGNDTQMRDALLSYASHAGLPGLALRLGSAISSPEDGNYYDAALYPKGNWLPEEGYEIDPALVHAIMRQESRFNPLAESPSGAKGLMQLMPSTAKYVAGGRKASALTNPEINLEIGQKYLSRLLKDKTVQGDLLSLLVAYNAGPGNLARWRKALSDVQDPLLFIELIPSRETRSYVERVLANYWIYRLRDDLDTPTLDAVAKGKVARYADAGYTAPFKLASSR